MNPLPMLRSALLYMLPFTLLLNAQTQAAPANGLVAFYPFNRTTVDTSGYNNHGTIVGSDWKYGPDRFGATNSLYLNTVTKAAPGTYVNAARNPFLDFNQDFTISVWVNFSETTSDYTVHNFVSNGSDQESFNMRTITDHMPGLDYLQSVWKASDPIGGTVYISTPAPRKEWWHFLTVRSGSQVSLFKNGCRIATSTNPAPAINTSVIWFGRLVGDNYHLIGGIDDVRMYSRALSLSEIQNLYLSEANCIPHKAQATARVVAGVVTSIELTDLGCGYTNAPVVVLRGGGGTNATATAMMNQGGVTQILITNGGTGYTNAPRVLIASPPFVPTLDIAVSRVKVTQHVVLGKNYVLESSTNVTQWTPVASPFTAQDEEITDEFEIGHTGRFFRIRQVP